ncbi:MAG: phage terminase large subunit, partial [Nitrosopumilus sp.]
PYEYTHHNGSVILFKGENYSRDKELDWMKGLEVNGFLFEEINECQETTLNKAFERAGSWIIPNLKKQPKPIILATCNPSNGWIKERVYDKWKNGTLPETYCYIPAKITDNPHLPEEYIESLKNLPKYEYMVFVQGNWDVQIKTGGEFWKSFELEKHVRPLVIDKTLSYHVSIDENVHPYITLSIWQIKKLEDGYDIMQIHEIPCKDPNNTARKSATKLSDWLVGISNDKEVFIYGDTSTKSGNTIDDNKRSFLDIFIEELSKKHSYQKRFFTKNPSVQATGEFINAIYEMNFDDINITINETCKVSISDYIETKQDVDGTILKRKVVNPKTGVRYEPHGHFSDAKRYFIAKCFNESYTKFLNRFSDISNAVFAQGNKNIRGGI